MDGLLPWGVVDNPINACMDKIFMEIYQMNEQWRAEFEIDTPFVNPQPLCKNPINWLELKASGDYKFAHVQVAWRAYQAGRQAGVEEVDTVKIWLEFVSGNCLKLEEENEGLQHIIQDRDNSMSDLRLTITNLKSQLKAERECVDMVNHKEEGYEDYTYGLREIVVVAEKVQSKRSL